MSDNKNENTNMMKEKNLDKVSGGVLFKDFSDDQYNDAGVQIGKIGSLSDETFLFKGKAILREEAALIVDFYHFYGRVPNSVEEALDWYRKSLMD